MSQTLYFCVLLSLIYVTYAAVSVQLTLFSEFELLTFYVCLIFWMQVTEEQMKNSAKMIRNICQPKFKLADGKTHQMKAR